MKKGRNGSNSLIRRMASMGAILSCMSCSSPIYSPHVFRMYSNILGTDLR